MAEEAFKDLERPLTQRPGSQSLGPIINSKKKHFISKTRRCKSSEASYGQSMQPQSTMAGTSGRRRTSLLPNIDAKGSAGGEAEEYIWEILENLITAAIEQAKGIEPVLKDAVRLPEVSESSESKDDVTDLHQAVKRCIHLLQRNDALEKKITLLLRRMDVVNAKKHLQKIKVDIALKNANIRKINGEIRWYRCQLRDVRKFTTKFEKEALNMLEQITEFERGSLVRYRAERQNRNKKDEKTEANSKKTRTFW